MEHKTLFTTARIFKPVINTRTRYLGLICFIACLVNTQQIVAQNFREIPLTHPDGSFWASSINNLAQIAGTVVINSTNYHAVRREHDGQFTNLTELGGNVSQAFNMNEFGEVIGFTVDENGFGHVVVWENGGFRELEVPADASLLPIPLDINNTGVVIGYYTDGSGLTHALVWDTNGVVQKLPENLGNQSSPSAINDAGEIAGMIRLVDGTARAYFWQPNSNVKSIPSTQLTEYTATDLGTLGGAGALALDINNNGQIVGMANYSTDPQFVHAFVWQDGVMVDLGTLGGLNSRANSINDAGFIVGRSLVGDSVATKSTRSTAHQGIPSDLLGNVQVGNQFVPMHPMNFTAAPDDEYNAFYARWSYGLTKWTMSDFHDWVNKGTITDLDDAFDVNLDGACLSSDHETFDNLLVGDILFISPDASGGEPGSHVEAFPSYSAANASSLLNQKRKIYMRPAVYQEDVSIPSDTKNYIGMYDGLGATEMLNPANGIVTFYSKVLININGSATFDGGKDNTWNFDSDLEVFGKFRSKGWNNLQFKKNVTLGLEGIMGINSHKDATNKVTLDQGAMGQGTFRLKGFGNTRFDIGGPVEVKVDVAKKDNGSVFFDPMGFSIRDVYMTGGSLVLQSDATQDSDGMLELNKGKIVGNHKAWTILNPDPAAINGGSEDSYFTGELRRRFQSAGMYNMPIGKSLYSPLSLDFEQDLDAPVTIGVEYVPTDDHKLNFSGTYVDVPKVDRELFLDVLVKDAWKVNSEGEISRNPDILGKPSDVKNVKLLCSLHLVSFDGKGNFVGVAGSDPTLIQTTIIDGVPNVYQPDVTLMDSMFLGIATNRFLNPIDQPEDSFARVQIINIAPGIPPVDVYTNDVNIHFPLKYSQGTPYGAISAGNKLVDIVDTSEQTNSNPIVSKNIDFGLNKNLSVVFSGLKPSLDISIIPDARIEATDSNKVDIRFFHGHPNIGPIDFQLVVNGSTTLYANQLEYGNYSEYKSEVPALTEIPLLGSLFKYDLSKHKHQSLQIFLMPRILQENKSQLKDGETDFDLLVLDAFGLRIEPTEITSVGESMMLPSEFALGANYPNPFNHSTKIGYELPRASAVRLTVSNLQGQTVRKLVDAQQQAGYHTIEWDSRDEFGKELASGLYLLRFEAGNFEQSRTMMMIK